MISRFGAGSLVLLLLLTPMRSLGAEGRSPGLAVCPPPGDVLSLLEPGDSAYPYAAKAADFLQRHGFVVRCVTRSVMAGTIGIGKVAAFQTDRGTITIFFVRASERVTVFEDRTKHGYRYTFTKEGRHPATALVKDGGRAYYFHRGDWLIQVWLPELATDLRKILD